MTKEWEIYILNRRELISTELEEEQVWEHLSRKELNWAEAIV